MLSKTVHLKHSVTSFAILILFIALAFLSYRYKAEIDITLNNSNTLSIPSQKLLKTLDKPITITAYIRSALPIRKQIQQLINRYQHHKKDIKLIFVDPEKNLEKARELKIGAQGLVVVEYQGRSEKITYLDESNLTNALLQLANTKQRWISFLTGHGERSSSGKANFDLSLFAKELKRRNINSQDLNLVKSMAIPDNSALLVISSPRVEMLAGEIQIIKNYLQRGGNLLLLTEPDDKHLDELMFFLDIKKLTGTIIDTSSNLYGIDDPSFVLISEYPRHPINQGMLNISVYPTASALQINTKTNSFNYIPFLNTIERSWTETGEIKGAVRFDANTEERQGPLTIGFALTRKVNNKQQRIVVLGDGDFLSNTFLGNVGNLEMGLRIFNWLIHDDKFIDIPAKISVGKSLQLNDIEIIIISFGFLIVLPASLFIIGFIIWRKRKRS